MDSELAFGDYHEYHQIIARLLVPCLYCMQAESHVSIHFHDHKLLYYFTRHQTPAKSKIVYVGLVFAIVAYEWINIALLPNFIQQTRQYHR